MSKLSKFYFKEDHNFLNINQKKFIEENNVCVIDAEEMWIEKILKNPQEMRERMPPKMFDYYVKKIISIFEKNNK